MSQNPHAVVTALERIAAAEAVLGVRLDYQREMATLGAPVLGHIQAITAMNRAAADAALPAAIRQFATLGAVQQDDCGACVQIHVNLDRAEGADPALLRAALAGRPQDLPAPLGLAWRFGQAVAANAPELEALRQELEQYCGRAAMIELSFHIAVARFYPTVKRALGYAQSCALVQVAA